MKKCRAAFQKALCIFQFSVNSTGNVISQADGTPYLSNAGVNVH